MKTKNVLLTILAIVILGVIVLLLVHKPAMAPTEPAMTGTETSGSGTVSSTGTTATSSASGSTGTSVKSSPNIIRLSGGQHGTTTELAVGQEVEVTAIDPASAAYHLDPLQYDSSILSLISHQHIAAGTNGSESYTFVAAKSGTTGLTITASQAAPNTTVTLFSGVISVK